MYPILAEDLPMQLETLDYTTFRRDYNLTWKEVKDYSVVPPYRATSEDWEPKAPGTTGTKKS